MPIKSVNFFLFRELCAENRNGHTGAIAQGISKLKSTKRGREEKILKKVIIANDLLFESISMRYSDTLSEFSNIQNIEQYSDIVWLKCYRFNVNRSWSQSWICSLFSFAYFNFQAMFSPLQQIEYKNERKGTDEGKTHAQTQTQTNKSVTKTFMISDNNKNENKRPNLINFYYRLSAKRTHSNMAGAAEAMERCKFILCVVIT